MENPESAEWQAPPPPEKIPAPEQPQMSEVATLGNIFFEPGRTFEDLKRKPRFILASIIVALLVSAYGFTLYYKVGDKGVREFIVEQIDKSPQASAMDAAQKSRAVDMQMTISKVARFVMPVLIVVSLLIGALLYWAGAKAFGGNGGFLHALSVWVYSTLPPAVIGMVANLIVLIFKSTDQIDLATSQRGVIHASPAFFIDGKSSPVLATVVGTLDLFMIWGWILAAIGLRITNKLSSGSAWAIVIIIGLIGVMGRVLGAFFSGNPT